jgi:hypothetical protein
MIDGVWAIEDEDEEAAVDDCPFLLFFFFFLGDGLLGGAVKAHATANTAKPTTATRACESTLRRPFSIRSVLSMDWRCVRLVVFSFVNGCNQ